jgi:hypothetical protein
LPGFAKVCSSNGTRSIATGNSGAETLSENTLISVSGVRRIVRGESTLAYGDYRASTNGTPNANDNTASFHGVHFKRFLYGEHVPGRNGAAGENNDIIRGAGQKAPSGIAQVFRGSLCATGGACDD